MSFYEFLACLVYLRILLVAPEARQHPNYTYSISIEPVDIFTGSFHAMDSQNRFSIAIREHPVLAVQRLF